MADVQSIYILRLDVAIDQIADKQKKIFAGSSLGSVSSQLLLAPSHSSKKR
jgi:hypothetical protein